MGITNLSFSATNINVGLNADKTATPRKGDMYIATDTEIMYLCYADDTWVSDELTEAQIDTAKPNIVTGVKSSLTGNNTVNRAIPHGLVTTPKIIILTQPGYAHLFVILESGKIGLNSSGADTVYTVTAMDDTNFYVGNASNYTNSCNATDVVYNYVVIA